MEERTVERFRKRTVRLHWIHTGAFMVLALTGGAMFLHGGGYGGLFFLKPLHILAALVFIGVPLVNFFMDPESTSIFVKVTFRFDKEDLLWVIGAPDYYFGGPEDVMPALDRLNPGQKLWQAVIIVTGIIFFISGLILLFLKWNMPIPVYEWMLIVHAIAFVIVIIMFLVHVYLAVFHPRFKESFRSMLDGRVSPTYARAHFSKWYDKKIS